MKACKSGTRAGTDIEVNASNVNISSVSIPQMDAANLASVAIYIHSNEIHNVVALIVC